MTLCCSDATSLTESLVGSLVDDASFTDAYEAVSAPFRAWMKTTIAMHHALYGIAPSAQQRTIESVHTGCFFVETKQPVPWVLVVVDEYFCSGVRLLAALMPALLAGVQAVHVVRVSDGTSAWPASLLAALELAGQETARSVLTDDFPLLLSQLEQQGTGRIIVLGTNPQLSQEDCTQSTDIPSTEHLSTNRSVASLRDKQRSVLRTIHAHAPHIPLWYTLCSPVLGVAEQDIATQQLLKQLHPDAIIIRWLPESTSSTRVKKECAKGDVGASVSASYGTSSAHLPKDVCDGASHSAPALATANTLSRDACSTRFDAIYCSKEDVSRWLSHSPLVFSEGRQGCWFYPDIMPDYFVRRTVAAGTVTCAGSSHEEGCCG